MTISGNAVNRALHGIYLDTVDRVVVGRNEIGGMINKPSLRIGDGVSAVTLLDERLGKSSR